jgi:steroid 5-alpha reductase family enzyme
VSSYPWHDFGVALPWAGGAVLVVLACTFAVSKVAHKHSVIDTAWGLLFAAMAITVFLRSSGIGCPARRWLLLILPVVWGVRLAQHIGRRTIGKPEDPRYAALLAKAQGREGKPRNPDLYAIRMVYLLQGALAFVIAAPILMGTFEGGRVGVIGWIGVGVWCIGIFFEAVGDLQLERYRANPANKGGVIDTGLWRYTRHPNYFGDACVWWGIYLVAASTWPGVVTVFAPILMTLLLTRGSGARILEAYLRTRPGWDDYVARTSGFFPLPPRKPKKP